MGCFSLNVQLLILTTLHDSCHNQLLHAQLFHITKWWLSNSNCTHSLTSCFLQDNFFPLIYFHHFYISLELWIHISFSTIVQQLYSIHCFYDLFRCSNHSIFLGVFLPDLFIHVLNFVTCEDWNKPRLFWSADVFLHSPACDVCQALSLPLSFVLSTLHQLLWPTLPPNFQACSCLRTLI